jgi:hypothetical protein
MSDPFALLLEPFMECAPKRIAAFVRLCLASGFEKAERAI